MKRVLISRLPLIYVSREQTNQSVTENLTVNTADIVDGAVTDSKLSSNSINTINVSDNNITNNKLIDNAIQTTHIADNNIMSNKIQNNAVTTDKLIDNCIVNSKLTNNCVATTNLIDLSVTDSNLALNSIGTSQFPNTTFTSATAAKFSNIENISFAISANVARTKRTENLIIMFGYGQQTIPTGPSTIGDTMIGLVPVVLNSVNNITGNFVAPVSTTSGIVIPTTGFYFLNVHTRLDDNAANTVNSLLVLYFVKNDSVILDYVIKQRPTNYYATIGHRGVYHLAFNDVINVYASTEPSPTTLGSIAQDSSPIYPDFATQFSVSLLFSGSP